MFPFPKAQRIASAACLLLWIGTFLGCHGFQADPASAQDFTLALSPATLAADANDSNSTFTVSIAGQYGFANPVSINISGVPGAAKVAPSSLFNVASGG